MMTTSTDPSSEPTAERQLGAGPESADISEPQRHELDRRNIRKHTEELLDEALGETFPASDPIAICSLRGDSM